MSWKATSYVNDLYMCPNGEPITRSEKLLAFVLADSHNGDRNVCWPSIPLIAQRAIMDERTVRRCLESLQRKGVIDVFRPSHAPGVTQTYKFVELEPQNSGQDVQCKTVENTVQKGKQHRAKSGHSTPEQWANSGQIGTRNKEELRTIEPRTNTNTKAVSETKSAWESLDPAVFERLKSELHKVATVQCANTVGWPKDKIARHEAELVRQACINAGIWKYLIPLLVEETYQAALREAS